ncbi:hypothetical protein A2533_01475 [Candidatus Falkowbacteria bacterium RIFOXYD2_FULL_35_9]|uniref:DAGKc domain-containing protein n=1 Tax=Candidatus Falkowbacteria bacterium RIFOXYC2_FULL_36_12 TaxID=1798002 RepID=A0A1F5SWX0_9BACT|nr:MAG: hypothetical protein A2478_00710 [Candidatus Falkowbacteria bacterium RIFOXYC2_FULL_36_12]OGF34381.1 MAG: hypothetical protein A2223_02510 [Candidatus Falkowbacteria bacterium RIFOXYA2_FULL_35_8]OGF45888.1 MAG: hypothetical protein A2533_01475 [Candidatus Falkowbacteria bacterium RIFOXYD2_FULL_35_9]
MYYYLYDSFLNDKKYEKVLDRIKTQLLDLDIQGKHERMSLLKNIDSSIDSEINKGIKTIIVVGNDKTFLKAVDVVARAGATLGIIPIGPDNLIAGNMGIPEAEMACEVIAARRIVKFDLGSVNNMYFFSNIKITKSIDRISISHQGYKVIPKAVCSEVAVINCPYSVKGLKTKFINKVNPMDGQLDLVIRSKLEVKGLKKYFVKSNEQKVDSIIQGKMFEIKSFEYLPLMVDDYKVIKTPVTVKMSEKKINVIIGKTRI